jgi:hypothetical protein
MKRKFSILCPSNILCGLLLTSAYVAQAEQMNIEIRIRPGSEVVGFPLQNPVVLEGQIQAIQSPLAVKVSHSSSVTSGTSIPDSPCYLIITGPIGHPHEGDHMELDEAASRIGVDGELVFDRSALNTVASTDPSWIGAEYAVIPHWTLQGAIGEMILQRLSLPNPYSPSFWVPLGGGNHQKIIPRLTLSPNPHLIWTLEKRSVWPSDKTILPPGHAFLMKSSNPYGFALSIGGDRRQAPCRVPLEAGPNLVSYPFADDMRLGIDWGKTEDGLVASSSPISCDRIYLYAGDDLLIYGLEASGQWLRILDWGTPSVRWDSSTPALSIIPAGNGFVVFKLNSDPLHTFHPPKA